MAKERILGQAGPVLFTADGAVNGLITVTSTKKFKANAKVQIKADTLPDIALNIIEVVSSTQMIIGDFSRGRETRVDLTQYTLALNASIVQGPQDRPQVPKDDQARSTYEQEPTLARRVILVDYLGRIYGDDNPIPVTMDGNGIKTPTIVNLPMPSAGSQYSLPIGEGVKRFYFKNRGIGKLQVSFVNGQTNTNFFTLAPGAVYGEEGLITDSTITIYFQSPKDDQLVELITWE